ncbi:hypothetical protein TIFTF001_025157 [Ficus carica]|uniref:Uncharacterized protein n=1 Tax=Ficus carica TaxID=3494 RepID=A0AA88AID3_FICCA|nr:hypothetical protein TIFTF001_025157 [Ficus carica]
MHKKETRRQFRNKDEGHPLGDRWKKNGRIWVKNPCSRLYEEQTKKSSKKSPREKEVAANGGRHQDGDNPGLPPRPPRRVVVPWESASVHNRGNLQERIQAHQDVSYQGTK